jgi:hypothetical protein
MTVKSLALYEIVKGIGLFAASRSRTVDAFRLVISSGFENLAVGATPVETLIAPGAGVTETTCGGKGPESINTTSTQ